MSPHELGPHGSPEGISPGPHTAIRGNPEVTACAMRFIATWAWIDAVRDRLAVALMSADHLVASEFMGAIHNPPAKRAAVISAMIESRGIDDAVVVEAAYKHLWRYESLRNDLVHHLWAFYGKKPDELILLDPKYLSSGVAAGRTVKWTHVNQQADLSKPGVVQRVVQWAGEYPESAARRMLPWENAIVYNLSELTSLLEELQGKYSVVLDLEVMVSGGYSEHPVPPDSVGSASQARERLSTLLQTEIAAIRRGRNLQPLPPR